MTEHSGFHQWANTVGVVASLVVGGYAAISTHQVKSLKFDDIKVESLEDPNCRLEFRDGWLTLCWSLYFHNPSDLKNSVVSYHTNIMAFEEIENPFPDEQHLGARIVDVSGKEIPFPLVLDAGESKRLDLRIAVKPCANATAAIKRLVATSNRTGKKLSIGELEAALNREGLQFFDGGTEDQQPSIKSTVVLGWLDFPANRGKQASVSLTWRNLAFQMHSH